MYNILVVDDEKIVRVALRTIINWEENGYHLVGAAQDGVVALKMVEDLKPDIIITDLKMPNMDGLELIKRLKTTSFNGKIIVLSNYNEFDLVREALKYGVMDYILKLKMKPEELLAILKEGTEQLRGERGYKESAQKMEKDYNNLSLSSKNNIFKELLDGNDDNFEEIMISAENLGIKIFKNSGAIIYVDIDNFKNSIDNGKIKDKKLLLSSITNIIHEVLFDINGVEIVNINNKNYTIIIPLQNSEDAMVFICRRAQSIANMIKLYINLTVGITMGGIYSGVLDMRRGYKDCIDAMKLKFYYGAQYISRISSEIVVNRNIRCDKASVVNECIKLMEIDNTKGIMAIFEALFKNAMEENYNPDNLKRLVVSILDNLDNAMIKFKENGSISPIYYDTILLEVDSLDIFSYKLEEILKDINHRSKAERGNKYRKEVMQVFNYVKQNLDKKLTLSAIALHVNMNESYLSRMFKNETGITIINFINNLKMESARELLKEPDAFVKEVAYAVGMDDQFYFNKMFNSHFGINPTEFKKQYNKRS